MITNTLTLTAKLTQEFDIIKNDNLAGLSKVQLARAEKKKRAAFSKRVDRRACELSNNLKNRRFNRIVETAVFCLCL